RVCMGSAPLGGPGPPRTTAPLAGTRQRSSCPLPRSHDLLGRRAVPIPTGRALVSGHSLEPWARATRWAETQPGPQRSGVASEPDKASGAMGARALLWGRQGRPCSLLTTIPELGSRAGPVSHDPGHTQEGGQAVPPHRPGGAWSCGHRSDSGIVPCIALTRVGGSPRMAAPPSGLGRGERAPDFVLPLQDGTPTRFYARAGGTPTVLLFCPAAQLPPLLPFVTTLAHRAAGPLALFAVQHGRPAAPCQAPFPVFADAQGTVTAAYRLGPTSSG